MVADMSTVRLKAVTGDFNTVDNVQKELEKMEMASWDFSKNKLKRSVCDLIASMTDRYALDLYSRLFLPKSFSPGMTL